MIIENIAKLIKRLRFGGGPFKCIVCGQSVSHFFPFSSSLESRAKENGFPYEFRRMETLNYDQCNCPFCLSADRERLYMIYLEQLFRSQAQKRYEVLDFAPNNSFSKNMKARTNVRYTSADFNHPEFDLKVDITNMPQLASNFYDVLICSHILEHVTSPGMALQEISRVLKSDGVAIVMVPLFWDVHQTVEDLSTTSDEQRLRMFGQDDHVRLFSKEDFLNQLGIAGFEVHTFVCEDFDPKVIFENAISSNSKLYICRKKIAG